MHKLTEDGLRASTKTSMLREEKTLHEETGESHGRVAKQKSAAAGPALMRRGADNRLKGQRKPRVTVSGVCKGPNAAVLGKLVGFRGKHADTC